MSTEFQGTSESSNTYVGNSKESMDITPHRFAGPFEGSMWLIGMEVTSKWSEVIKSKITAEHTPLMYSEHFPSDSI